MLLADGGATGSAGTRQRYRIPSCGRSDHLQAVKPAGTRTAPASISTLPNGHLLCVWNQENEEEVNLGSYQKLKVLPIARFHGGKEPADNPFLPRAYEPAQP